MEEKHRNSKDIVTMTHVCSEDICFGGIPLHGMSTYLEKYAVPITTETVMRGVRQKGPTANHGLYCSALLSLEEPIRSMTRYMFSTLGSLLQTVGCERGEGAHQGELKLFIASCSLDDSVQKTVWDLVQVIFGANGNAELSSEDALHSVVLWCEETEMYVYHPEKVHMLKLLRRIASNYPPWQLFAGSVEENILRDTLEDADMDALITFGYIVRYYLRAFRMQWPIIDIVEG